jgi:hypothetical protein
MVLNNAWLEESHQGRMKWFMDHVLIWGYMSKKDVAISSE